LQSKSAIARIEVVAVSSAVSISSSVQPVRPLATPRGPSAGANDAEQSSPFAMLLDANGPTAGTPAQTSPDRQPHADAAPQPHDASAPTKPPRHDDASPANTQDSQPSDAKDANKKDCTPAGGAKAKDVDSDDAGANADDITALVTDTSANSVSADTTACDPQPPAALAPATIVIVPVLTASAEPSTPFTPPTDNTVVPPPAIFAPAVSDKTGGKSAPQQIPAPQSAPADQPADPQAPSIPEQTDTPPSPPQFAEDGTPAASLTPRTDAKSAPVVATSQDAPADPANDATPAINTDAPTAPSAPAVTAAPDKKVAPVHDSDSVVPPKFNDTQTSDAPPAQAAASTVSASAPQPKKAAQPAITTTIASDAAATRLDQPAPAPAKVETPVVNANISGPPAAAPHIQATKPGAPKSEGENESEGARHLATSHTLAEPDTAQPIRTASADIAAKTTSDPLPHSGPLPLSQPALAAAPSNAAANPAPVVLAAIPLADVPVQIAAQAKDGKNRFEIRLDPPELGRIDVRLDIDSKGIVTSRLTAERPETLDLLRRDASQIERALQDAGLKTGDQSLQFSLRDQSFADRGDTSSALAPSIVLADDETIPLATLTQAYGRIAGLGGGIDIRV
jgi:flagellar hook-length control protein FliK